MKVRVRDDGRTATVSTEYVHVAPWYDPRESVIGMESGKLVFLSERSNSRQSRLVPRSELQPAGN